MNNCLLGDYFLSNRYSGLFVGRGSQFFNYTGVYINTYMAPQTTSSFMNTYMYSWSIYIMIECKHLKIEREERVKEHWDYKCMDCGEDMCICDDFDYQFHKSVDHRFDHDW